MLPVGNDRDLVGKPNGASGYQPEEKLNGSGQQHFGANGGKPVGSRTTPPAQQQGANGTNPARIIAQLHDPVSKVRAAAAKAIGQADYPEAIDALVSLLQDEDLAVRWAAMSSLIYYRCKAVRPLMLALTRDFHSINLRHGAHHVLKALHDYGDLNQIEMEVFKALALARPVLHIAKLANSALIAETLTAHGENTHPVDD